MRTGPDEPAAADHSGAALRERADEIMCPNALDAFSGICYYDCKPICSIVHWGNLTLIQVRMTKKENLP
jgi:hypothetical protein